MNPPSQTQHNKILITTAIDYTNDVVHVGHAYQKILADCLARFARFYVGKENTFFLTGTDEHGTTNEKAAKDRGLSPQEHVDDISQKDREQLAALNISFNRFIRTTDKDHVSFAADFLTKAYENGDIYKGEYVGYYCEGCESHKTLSELTEDKQCPLHKTRKIQEVSEENYFFKWSKYAPFLKSLIQDNSRFVLPEGKRKEMLAFLDTGLQDIPVSRPISKVSWGIPVPWDDQQTIYVWFDALVNYFTAANPIGFWDDDTEIIHILGKDNSRWHALLWPAMLKSAGYRVPDTIYVHGFINLNGQKISKSLGNIIRPLELVTQYGVDSIRYYFLKHGPIIEDVNISYEHLKEVYNADLANGLGNTVARIATLANKSTLKFTFNEQKVENEVQNFYKEHNPFYEGFRVDLILQQIWKRLAALNSELNTSEPWTKLNQSDKTSLQNILQYEVDEVRIISKLIAPYLPVTSEKILKQFANESIEVQDNLFPRM